MHQQPVQVDRPWPVMKWTAQQLGVHPAIHGATAPGADGVSFVLPPYLRRDHDKQLRDRLTEAASSGRATLVLLRGGSCTGKTRTAFEAVRAYLADWQLVFPKDATGLLALLNAGALPPHSRTVLWLNETQNYLMGAAGERAAAALHSRLDEPGPLLVLGTVWPERHHDLTKDDAHPCARALLALAVPVIDVPDSFPDDDTLKEPWVQGNRSLAAAIAVAGRISDGLGIAQILAAGPQLVEHYKRVTLPHGQYGQAVITAAMDARRLGHTSPLPAALLKAAAPDYLSEQQRAEAPADWFTHALDYAREKVMGVAAALEPVAAPDGMGAVAAYRLSDYLDQHAHTTRRYEFPPNSFWSAVCNHTASPQNSPSWPNRRANVADIASRPTCTSGPAISEARMPCTGWRSGRCGPGTPRPRQACASRPWTPGTRSP